MGHFKRCLTARRDHDDEAIHLKQCLQQLHSGAIIIDNQNFLGQSSLPWLM
jgi:hypothetical protein